MAQYKFEGPLLEVGSGTGEFVYEAALAGLDARGLEPSVWAAAAAQDLGARVDCAFLSDVSGDREAQPRTVAMWHVLEHTPEPLTLLREVASTLAPGGCLYLEVPNYESSDSMYFGTAWDGAQVDDHHTHFTSRGLRAILERAGFGDVSVSPLSREAYESQKRWAQQEKEARRAGRDWPPYDLLRARALLS